MNKGGRHNSRVPNIENASMHVRRRGNHTTCTPLKRRDGQVKAVDLLRHNGHSFSSDMTRKRRKLRMSQDKYTLPSKKLTVEDNLQQNTDFDLPFSFLRTSENLAYSETHSSSISGASSTCTSSSNGHSSPIFSLSKSSSSDSDENLADIDKFDHSISTLSKEQRMMSVIKTMRDKMGSLEQEIKFYKSLHNFTVEIPNLLKEVHDAVYLLKKVTNNAKHYDLCCSNETQKLSTKRQLSPYSILVSGKQMCNSFLETPSTSSADSDAQHSISFGSKKLTVPEIKEITHSSVSRFVSGLCSLVFTPEELALSSMKGRQCNAKKTDFRRRAIDEEKVRDIEAYVSKTFSTLESSKVRRYIGYKLNNYQKTEEGKKIIATHKLLLSPLT